jgi:hypothetical protein
MLKESVARSRRKSWWTFLDEGGRRISAATARPCGNGSQPPRDSSSCLAVTTALQLSPSPLNRAATRLHQPFPHHVVSLNVTVDSSIFRKTPHIHIRHVYRSLVSSRRKRLWGAKWEARVAIMVEEAFKSTLAPPLGRGHLL